MTQAVLVLAALRLATKGLFGVLVLMGGLFGYAFGAGMLLVA